jgi:hypothetical protein
MDKKWTGWHTLGLVGIVVAVALLGLLIPQTQILWAWILSLVALLLFAMLAGHGITGRFWLGWLINEQYRMSLSRLQMFLWTVVVLSALLTAALSNIRAGHADTALAIAIPEEVWLAMGISTVSLVGSPLILQGKKEKKTNEKEAEKTAIRLGLLAEDASPKEKEEVAEEHSIGQLDRNGKPQDAHLYDLVRGEEVGNADVLDLTRLQNLFFTLILIGSYAVSLGAILKSAKGVISAFPEIGQSNLALLAISHAGYLVSKAVDKQPEGEETPEEPEVPETPGT